MSNETNDEKEKELKVNKWDLNATKNAIDDAVKLSFTNANDCIESHSLLDLRLIISVISVATAGSALLYDWLYPFPKSRMVLILCVAIYFVMMCILQLYAWYVECGIFYVAIDRDPTGKRPDRCYKFASKMKKFDDIYSLEVTLCDNTSRRTAKLQKSITQWIDTEGVIVLPIVSTDVLRLCESLGDARKHN